MSGVEPLIAAEVIGSTAAAGAAEAAAAAAAAEMATAAAASQAAASAGTAAAAAGTANPFLIKAAFEPLAASGFELAGMSTLMGAQGADVIAPSVAKAVAAESVNPLMASAYGSLPGMTMGSQQAAMLAAQTGEFGIPGLMSTGGSATYAGAGGPLAKMAFSSGSPTAMRMGMQGINLMQQSAPQAAPAPGIKRGQQMQAVNFADLMAQPIQRKRISLL